MPLFSILIPPIGVLLTVGLGAQFWLNVLLTIFGYIPGVIHALYVSLTYPNRRRGAAA